MAFRVVVLISGNGSNLQAIIDAHAAGTLPVELVTVMSNRKDAYGLTRATNAGIPTSYFPLKPFKDAGKTREEYDAALVAEIQKLNPDLIVLAGWMHILSKGFVDPFEGKIINLHPALPGQFDGANAIERAYEAFKKGEITSTGVMVHKVTAVVDHGEVICQKAVPILPADTLADLQERMHSTEHELIVEGVRKLATKP
ncbi:phosphoribosylglycinamide formyltransferase [Capsaspora owczarzaki ATCC 30864]|uniref:phosphoribosylglycinamide formyltransferase 1 n=1 Tax=Capsaspora owczarzaki (strain ATCC 30864) TaxID=595528 RepID=A0A0D2U802_CAPO3|nr:phosphoribosylglycinamide formyltransferase [Capsaspora owczarzaki ATCC 30864]KJE91221.1 phosphoribosylglycinamide formyltransferase [Capsaspora owczarzaki ATCC 30864]|eukprot:XP_004349137.1 phosphoribosylglycinamide formyltransferase [Capsaspora owczarzaki ATCC 30864]